MGHSTLFHADPVRGAERPLRVSPAILKMPMTRRIITAEGATPVSDVRSNSFRVGAKETAGTGSRSEPIAMWVPQKPSDESLPVDDSHP